MPDICDDRLKKTIKMIKNMKKISSKIKFSAKERKTMRASCEKSYMNPGCKGTIFEDGPVNKLPTGANDFIKGDKNLKGKIGKMFESMLKKERKELFGKRKTILKDNFYYKLSNKTVRNLKKKGATSGCTRFDEDN